MTTPRTSRQHTLATASGLGQSHERLLMAIGKLHVISHLNSEHNGVLDRHLHKLFSSKRLPSYSYETLHYLYFHFKVVKQLCDQMVPNVDRGGVLNSYFRLIACALLRSEGTQLDDDFVQKTLEVMSQLVADITSVLNVTICGLLEGAVGGVVAKFMEAFAAADCALTDPPASAEDAPIRPTQVVKHRDELEHAFELQRLCFQASQATIEKLSGVRQKHSHSQRAEGRPIHLPELEKALDFFVVPTSTLAT
ncbi:hypothetical protein GQ42DRAFT_181444 [Ramicandelaber brevisporus]|nr:hypothetical protein GQ42DRAFT_181444 [Ramicandelaber brevisporus]